MTAKVWFHLILKCLSDSQSVRGFMQQCLSEGQCWDMWQSRHIAIWAIYLGAWEVRQASIVRRDAWCDGHPYRYYFDGISSYINYTVLTRLGRVGRATHLSRLSFDWGEYGIFYLLLTLLIVVYLSVWTLTGTIYSRLSFDWVSELLQSDSQTISVSAAVSGS
jgi:hypothetical protein